MWRQVVRWMIPAAVALPVTLFCQQEPEGLLDRIKARMEETLARQPDYVCLETVQRTRSLAPGKPFELLDTLRLDVGLAGNKEMFAWKDSRRFDDRDLAELVGKGTIGTGNFAMHASSVFLSGIADFAWRGEEELGGRRAIRYDYEVPRKLSRYRVRAGAGEGAVGYQGSFWVDPDSLDLMRLELEANDVPDALGLAHLRDVMDYARVTVGASEFLLPRRSELTLESTSGEQNRNRAEFSACRQFVGEATVKYDETVVTAAPEIPGSILTLPPRTVLELSLESEIEMEAASIGDPVRATLVKPLRDGARVVAPEGTPVIGRLVRIEKNAHPVAHYQVGMQFYAIDSPAARAEFTATMEEVTNTAGLLREAKRLDPTFSKQRKGKLEILVREHPHGQGVLHWDAKQSRIRPGLKMKWIVEPEREAR